jgi:aspartokinase
MINISEKLKELLENDEIALEATKAGFLNFSAYATSIHKELEKKCKKSIKHSTIVVSLTRIAKTLKKEAELKPTVYIEDLSIKSPLYELTYEKTRENTLKLSSLNNLLTSHNDFFIITQGIDEVTIICSKKPMEIIKGHFTDEPKSFYKGLVAVTVKFSEEYLTTPNVIYGFISAVAVKRINVIEIISTYTELTFILKNEDMNKAVEVFEQFFQI